RTDLWILVGPRGAEIGAGDQDPRDRAPQVIVASKRGSDERLQLRVFEDIEPLEVSEGRRLGGGCRIRSSEDIRCLDCGPGVFRSYRTARQEAHKSRSNDQSLLH